MPEFPVIYGLMGALEALAFAREDTEDGHLDDAIGSVMESTKRLIVQSLEVETIH